MPRNLDNEEALRILREAERRYKSLGGDGTIALG